MREYLATGKPVVISPLYEYLNTPGVRIYRSTDEFISAVESALRDDTNPTDCCGSRLSVTALGIFAHGR